MIRDNLTVRLHNALGRAFFPLSITAVIAVLVIVQTSLETRFAVFGLYALLGLIAGAIIYYGTSDIDKQVEFNADGRLSQTGVYVVSALTIGIVAITDEPLAIAGGIVVVALLLVRQLFDDQSPERLLPQITVFFLLSPITKYLTSGQYIGHGDIIHHTRFVGDLFAGGSIEALSYTNYQEFPGLHLIAGTIGSLSGLGPYDGIMLTGLAAYVILIPAVYLITVRLTDHPELALCTAFAVAIIDNVSFFASYVFPQSIATVFVIVLAVLGTLASKSSMKWRILAVFSGVVVVLSFTHHLTQVLFFPVLGVGLALYVLHGRPYAKGLLRSPQFVMLTFAIAVTIIRLVQTGFIDRIVEKAYLMVQGGAFAGYSEVTRLGFGQSVWTSTVGTAIDWLTSPYGLYLILLVAVFSIGVVTFFRSERSSPVQLSLFWSGIAGSLLVFETPISIQSLIRISFPWIFVFAFVLGVGLLKLRRLGRTPSSRVAVLALVVVLTATTPMVTADDYYNLDPRPSVQTSFSEQEISELEVTANHLQEKEISPSSFGLTRAVMAQYGVTDLRTTRFRDDSLVLPEDHFIYRNQWSDHKVHFTASSGGEFYSSTMFIDRAWLNERVATGNKVYSSGGVGIMWSPEERPFDDT